MWLRIMGEARNISHAPDPDEDSLIGELMDLQFPSDTTLCKTRPVAGFSFNSLTLGYGIGVYLNVALNAFMWSIQEGHLLHLAPDGLHRYAPSWCGGFFCLFDAVSSCQRPFEVLSMESMKNAGSQIAKTRQPFKHLEWPGEIYDIGHKVPPRWAHRGIIWYKSVLARFLWQPQQFIVDKYFDFKDRVLPVPFYAMHIRRTDKVNDNPHTPTSRYLDALNLAAISRGEPENNTTAVVVYVATDGPEVAGELDEARASISIGGNSNVIFKLMDTSRPAGGAVWNTDKIDVIDSIVELCLLVASKVFVGTSTSNYGRMVWTLRGTNSSDIFSVDREFLVFP
jgi:hypothetical protein